MKQLVIFLFNLIFTFATSYLGVVDLEPGIHAWQMIRVRRRNFEVNKIHEGFEPAVLRIRDASSYIVLKIVAIENSATTSQATSSTNKKLEAVHFWTGRECKLETRKETVKFMTEILHKYSPVSPGTVKIFKETYRLQSGLFRNMFSQINVEGNAQNPRPHLFQLTFDPANEKRVLIYEQKEFIFSVHHDEAVVFHSYRIPEVRVVSVAPRKKSSPSSSNENMHEKVFREYREKQPQAIKNIISLIEYYYGSIKQKKQKDYEDITYGDFSELILPSEIMNLSDSNKGIELREHFIVYGVFNPYVDTVTEKRTITSKFHTDKIKQKGCYLFINHTMNHMFVLIGYRSGVELIQHTFKEVEKFESEHRYWVTVVQKENLPVSFIILFQDLIEVLSKSHDKVDNMIDEIVFKLKLVPRINLVF